jgi:hypothetical protein
MKTADPTIASQTHIVDAWELTPHDREQMLRLMQEYYVGVTEEIFSRDLAEKRWVILLTDASGRLRGFSTQMLLDHPTSPGVRALFSGDTIVDRAWWGRNELAGTWGRLALRVIAEDPRSAWYWMLTSKGYKTYRYLPLFFHEFYPRLAADTPAMVAAHRDAFGRAKFGEAYDPARGIVAALHAGGLRPHVAPVDAFRLGDPQVQFFAQCNPGHAAGDELCCLAPLTRENFTPAAWRVIRAASREGDSC